MLEALNIWFTNLHAWLFETLVQPAMYALGFMTYVEDAYDATGFFLSGCIEIVVLVLLFRPLEALWPVERWPDRQAVRVDILYTILHRLGLLPLIIFILLRPWVDGVDGFLRLHNIIPYNLEDLVPGLAHSALLAFVLYLLVLDLALYLLHRLQHRLEWWWALHSLHHSQRQLSFWADDRNHLLDNLIRDAIFALIAVLIGVQPRQFVLLVIATRSLESFQHANVRLWFGRWGERLLVSPRFHRRHHAIGDGHEGVHRGCNFAVLFPVWDVLFGTANYEAGYPATGVRDQLASDSGPGRDYGRGFWLQQWLGLRRMMRD